MIHDIKFNWYSFERGFEGTNPLWYKHVVFVADPIKVQDILVWLYTHVDNAERHCRWCRFYDRLEVKFRYEKDYVWFRLVF